VTRIWLLAGILAAASVAAAQEAPERPRERAARVLDRYLERQLRGELGLSDEEVARVMPAIRRVHETRRDDRDRRMRALQDLREALASGAATEADVATRVATLKKLERQEAENLLRNREAVDGLLTPVQQGKLRLLELALQRKVRDFRRGGGHRRP
jgi:hypothetical protein